MKKELRQGFCYKCDKDGMLINTLTETSRGAKVNALVAVGGVPISRYHTDLMINSEFTRCFKNKGEIVEVVIKEMKVIT